MKPNQLQILENKTQLVQKFRGFALLGRQTLPANPSNAKLNYMQTQQWLKRADILGNNVNNDEFTALFHKYKSENITMDDFMTLVEDISRRSNVPVVDLHAKLLEVTVPKPYDVEDKKSSSLSGSMASTSSGSSTVTEMSAAKKL